MGDHGCVRWLPVFPYLEPVALASEVGKQWITLHELRDVLIEWEERCIEVGFWSMKTHFRFVYVISYRVAHCISLYSVQDKAPILRYARVNYDWNRRLCSCLCVQLREKVFFLGCELSRLLCFYRLFVLQAPVGSWWQFLAQSHVHTKKDGCLCDIGGAKKNLRLRSKPPLEILLTSRCWRVRECRPIRSGLPSQKKWKYHISNAAKTWRNLFLHTQCNCCVLFHI